MIKLIVSGEKSSKWFHCRSTLVAAAFITVSAGLLSAYILSLRPEVRLNKREEFSSERESPHKNNAHTEKRIADPCQAPWRLQLQQHLRNVVLVINYNNPIFAYNSTALIRAVYGPFFQRITFLGPRDIPEAGVQVRSSTPLAERWYWSYVAFEKLLRDHPKAEGFLWMSDDVALNHWNLLKADKSKIWMKRYRGRNFPFNSKQKSSYRSDWADYWKKRKGAWAAFLEMEQPFKQQFGRSMHPYKYMFPKRVVDLMYLPRNHTEILTKKLVPVYSKHKVWWEIAVPMMLFSVEHPNNYDGVLDNMEYRWEHRTLKGKVDEYDPMKYWTPDICAMHPWKFSTEEQRRKFVVALGHVDACLTTVDVVETVLMP